MTGNRHAQFEFRLLTQTLLQDICDIGTAPVNPLYFLFLLLCATLLFTFVQIGVLTIVFEKLGLTPEAGLVLIFTSLFGSMVNLPLFSIEAKAPPAAQIPRPWRDLWRQQASGFTGRTIVAVNLGGCIVPLGISIYLISHHSLDPGEVLLTVTVVSGASFFFSRPIQGVGVGIPLFVAPAVSAITGILIGQDHAAPLAYIGGTLGVLIGADLFRLPSIRQMGVAVASIGGAGTFDGIFLTGIVATLLA